MTFFVDLYDNYAYEYRDMHVVIINCILEFVAHRILM